MLSTAQIWNTCLQELRQTIPGNDVDTWIMPLHCHRRATVLKLLAPNRYVLNHVRTNLFSDIEKTVLSLNFGITEITLNIGSYDLDGDILKSAYNTGQKNKTLLNQHDSQLNPNFTFNNHVEGKSNQVARAAAHQVGNGPGLSYNPLFIYGGVGLGKTHLMQAAGNQIMGKSADAKVLYIHSERFVNNMVTALKNNTINEFKNYFRSLDALLIDDIQFFAKKTQSQEEFFHTFNALLEGQRQIIITSDRIPKAINHLEERLISRFGSGLTVSIEPPELETRVAILLRKATDLDIDLPGDVAFFVANIVRSNVRELEGALQLVCANAKFTGRKIDIGLTKDALKDILLYRQKQITIENIQQTVAEYFKIRVSELLSKKRSREITRPRQLAMSFAKEFTNLSLPQIGDKFGGRDHSTVIHACRKVQELIKCDSKIKEDHQNLQRLFGG